MVAPLLKETAKAHKRTETKEMTVTELELRSLLLKKKKREGRHFERVELALWSNLEKEEGVETRETLDHDQGECRDPRKHEASISTGVRLRSKKNPKQFSQTSSKTSTQFLWTKKILPQSERLHWMELGKNLRVDCAGGMLISTKKLERVLSTLKNGKGSPDQFTADVLKALPLECLEKLARSLSVMCWDMNFPKEWLCSLAVVAARVVGATCLTRFRPIAGLCAMRNVLGYVWLKSLPPLRYESVQCRRLTQMLVCSCCSQQQNYRENGRERNCGGAIGREEGIRSRGSSSCLQGNEITRCESVFGGLDGCNLEWKLHESTFVNGTVEQSTDESWTAPGRTGVSGHARK